MNDSGETGERRERRRAAVVVASDGVVAGTRTDTSGPLAVEMLTGLGFSCDEPAVVSDEAEEISAEIVARASAGVSLIVTTGGTGFGPRDVTPEATRAVIDREAPGMAGAIRAGSPAKFAALTRGIAGLRGRTLILNLPGSRGGVRDGIGAVSDALVHAVELASGVSDSHPKAAE